VFYEQSHIPHLGDKVHGGIIKFQHMQKDFPNSSRRFNILYMVSSWMRRGVVQITWFARRKGVRLVWNQNGVAYPGWHGPGWEKTNPPMAKLLHAADYVFYQSEFCRESADRYLVDRVGPWEVLYILLIRRYLRRLNLIRICNIWYCFLGAHSTNIIGLLPRSKSSPWWFDIGLIHDCLLQAGCAGSQTRLRPPAWHSV